MMKKIDSSPPGHLEPHPADVRSDDRNGGKSNNTLEEVKFFPKRLRIFVFRVCRKCFIVAELVSLIRIPHFDELGPVSE